MKLIDHIRSRILPKRVKKEDGGTTTIIIDLPCVLKMFSTHGDQQPHQVIKRITLFTEQEQCPVVVVLPSGMQIHSSRPGDMGKLTVINAPDEAAQADTVIRQVRKKGANHKVVVITADAALEKKIAAMGAGVMKPATFNKALPAIQHSSSPHSGAHRSPHPPQQRRSRQPQQQHSPPRPAEQTEPCTNDEELPSAPDTAPEPNPMTPPQAAPKPSTTNKTIMDLIDPL